MKKILLSLGTFGAVVAPIASVVSCGDNSDNPSTQEGSLSSFLEKSPNYQHAGQAIVSYKLENWVGGHDIKYLKFQYLDGTIGSIKLSVNGWIGTGNDTGMGTAKYEKSWAFQTQTEREVMPTISFKLTNGKLDINVHSREAIQRITKAFVDTSQNTHASYQDDLSKYASGGSVDWLNTIYDPNVSKIISDNIYSEKSGYFDYSKKPDEVGVRINPGLNSYPMLSMDYNMDFSKQDLIDNKGYTDKEVLLAAIGGIAKKYGLIQSKVVPGVGCIPNFTFIDWNGKKTVATIGYDVKNNIEKIAIDSSETNYFSHEELTDDQFIV